MRQRARTDLSGGTGVTRFPTATTVSENPSTSVRPSPGPGRSSFCSGSRTGAAEERKIP